jgi:tetratricopeptide (TPR) repeat protein
MFEEAMSFLIETYHDPASMHNLAFHYLEKRRHDLELKYLEMAAEYDFPNSLEELGYIWYYGQTGEVDYKKAYEYFERASKCDNDSVVAWSRHKLADMYHNGYYVEKDEARYRQIVEELYADMTEPDGKYYRHFFGGMPYADVAWRLGKIRAEEGRVEEALVILEKARKVLSEDIRSNPSWWGNIEVMDDITTLANEISSEDKARLDIYDLYWISKNICKVAFLYNDRRFIIDITPGEEGNIIGFDNKWYRNARGFFEKAEIDGKKIVFIYDEICDMEVEYGRVD